MACYRIIFESDTRAGRLLDQLLVPGLHALIDIRVLCLLRVFRIFKLMHFVAEYQVMGNALLASRRKILVFMSVVALIVVVMGTLMYVVEGPANGYTSILAATTMTTTGFGDITPKTEFGLAHARFCLHCGARL